MIFGYNLYNATLFSEYLIQFIVCFSLMFLVDRLFAPRSARWYFLHVFMNGMISYFTWPDVMFCLTHPKNCYAADQHLSNTLGWMMGLSGHIYHMVSFDDLRFDDYMHHILMFPFAGLAGLIALRKPGFNFAIFALTGMPGGIDFVLLTLVKLGYIDKYTEKRLNIYIQTWFRMPLLVFNCGIFYAEMFEGHISPWCLIGVGLSYWNGIYYMHDTLSNYYHKHYNHVLNMSKSNTANSTNVTTNNMITMVEKPNEPDRLIKESSEEVVDNVEDDNKDEQSSSTEEISVSLSNDDTEESSEKHNKTEQPANDTIIDDESVDSPPTPHVTEESLSE